MDPQIQQIIDMVKGLGFSGWGMIAVALAMIYFQWKAGNLPILDPVLGRFFGDEATAVENTVPGQDGREMAFNAVDYLIEYFEAEGCPEGEAAARSLGPHLFHPHKPDGPSSVG